MRALWFRVMYLLYLILKSIKGKILKIIRPQLLRGGDCHRCLVSGFAGLRWLWRDAGGDGGSLCCFLPKVRTKGFVLLPVTLAETKNNSRGLWQGESGGRAPPCLSLCQRRVRPRRLGQVHPAVVRPSTALRPGAGMGPALLRWLWAQVNKYQPRGMVFTGTNN